MVKVGDLVFIVPCVSDHLQPAQLKRLTRGIIFSQIDKDWFRVHTSNKEWSAIQDFPRWMLQKIQESS